MIPLPNNRDNECFFVTKHSWKGKYKRVFSFGTTGISTYDEHLEVTNRWPYSDVNCLKPLPTENKFSISARKDGPNSKLREMTFSTEHRAELLTSAYKYHHLFIESLKDTTTVGAQKFHWSHTRLPVNLEITHSSLIQQDIATQYTLASYDFYSIESIIDVSDIPGGFVVESKPFGRLHLFICPNESSKNTVKDKMALNARTYIGVDLRLQNKPISSDDFITNRLGKFGSDEDQTSLAEFTVNKVGCIRHKDSPPRLLCLTSSCIIERDPETYAAVTVRPLTQVFSFVRNRNDTREFTIEYSDGNSRTYVGPNRDSIIATLLDGVRGVGNKDVHVKLRCTSRGHRWSPFHAHVDEEVESLHLKYLKIAIGQKTMSEMIERFNCNIPYSGLLHSVTQDGYFKDNKEKPIAEALQAVTFKSKEEYDIGTLCDEEVEALFQTLRRLLASKVGFASFTKISGLRECLGHLVVKGLKRENDAVTHASIEMLCALIHPMHDDCDLKQEQVNKSSLLSNKAFLNSLLDMWINYVNAGRGALVVAAMLDVLTFAICMPYSETTTGSHFDTLLELVAERGRSLFKLFQHPCLTIVKGAGLLLRALIEEGELEVSYKIQKLSLTEGALPRNLIYALYNTSKDRQRIAQCKIARRLVSLWLTNNIEGNELMKRILPSGLLKFLDSSETVPEDTSLEVCERDNLKLAQELASKQQRNQHVVNIERKLKILERQLDDAFKHWGTRFTIERKPEPKIGHHVVLRKGRVRVKSSLNWALFYHKFQMDLFLPNLIWNHKTRDELRTALEKEVRTFDSDREVSSKTLMAWNYAEFEVQYPSLKDQLCIDGYYIKVLLENKEAPESLEPIAYLFFNNLYHRFLLPSSLEEKCTCLQALTMVYDKYNEVIGFFPDTKYLINMLEKSFDRLERDRLLQFISVLTKNKKNVKEILDSNRITSLVDLMTIAHLHVSRAVLPTQSNVIEAGADMEREEEKEWHYCVTPDERVGPITFTEFKNLFTGNILTGKTKCWAQGMDSWQLLQNVAQLKWCLLARGNPIMHEGDVATLILNTLLSMTKYYPSRNEEDAVIWPMSKLKQVLSSSQCLPHLVQLLLTFDPVIVEKVATLLCFIAEDNTHTPKIYLTGVFYFILMYMGSNVLPIAQFLKLTHTKQGFRPDETHNSELMQRSILGQLLPDAMVHYLENHGPEKFANIFLGEFDTPEAIWNAEMRRLLIEKVSAHIADFSPRLRSNNRAQYQYASIPAIRYPQLHNELFCNIFYLRHLTDTTRFPDWPIPEPVALLRDVLELWKSEVEKKTPPMSVEEAYSVLELKSGTHHDEPVLRKAYYRLAQKYHPDKNPEGREKFELVNSAYEFLCSRSSWDEHGVNANNILLIINTQTILFQRYFEDMKPYKYAGYKQLIKTVQLEVNDDLLFSKQVLLLPAAIKLIYFTVHCSALNAEELNRERGLEAVLDAFNRCVSVLSESTKDKDLPAEVCFYATKCFTVAAGFPSCLTSFSNMPELIPDLVRILQFKNVIKLRSAVVECITALSKHEVLQSHLVKRGAVWYLVSFMFLYDYTLQECGIERTQDSSQQEACNELAKLSVEACARLSEIDPKKPEYLNVKMLLDKLLTPFVANQLAVTDPHEVLKTLNSNFETPYLLWDNATRNELTEFLEQQCAVRGEHDLEAGSNFQYSKHRDELIVGGVFLRVYNAQPTFPIENPVGLTLDLLDFLRKKNPSNIADDDWNSIRMVLGALTNVISLNKGVEIQCIGQLMLLCRLLVCNCPEEIHLSILHLLTMIARNEECVKDIAGSGVLIFLLLILHGSPNLHAKTLDVLLVLTTSSAVTKEMLAKGGLYYLLEILLSDTSLEIKVQVAEIFGRLCEDKISGPRVRLLLLQFLPLAICDTFRDSPASAVKILQTDHENPEIIWNESARKELYSYLKQMCERQYKLQVTNHDAAIKALPPVPNLVNKNELVVGGIYIRLFNQNPGWTVRKPSSFLSELLDVFTKLTARPDAEKLVAVSTALLNLLQRHPNLADLVPTFGHLSVLCIEWNQCDNDKFVSEHILKVLCQLSSNEACVSSLTQTDVLSPLKKSIVAYEDLASLGCEALSHMFDFKKDALVKVALEISLIQTLLFLLGGNLSNCRNPPRTKALIVKTLKSMAESPIHGPSVSSLLQNSSVWNSYKDQKHDLFITHAPAQTYLTDVPSPAGFLTQGCDKVLPNLPPPIDRDRM